MIDWKAVRLETMNPYQLKPWGLKRFFAFGVYWEGWRRAVLLCNLYFGYFRFGVGYKERYLCFGRKKWKLPDKVLE